MPDKDLTNLPILDDIILPGDAGKAVPDISSRVQSSLWNNDDSDKTGAFQTDDQAGMGTEAPEDTQLAHEQPVEDQLNIQAVDMADVAQPAAAPVEIPSDTLTFSDLPAETSIGQTAVATNVQDIEALTEEIMGNLMPDLEQRIREIVRQTLQQHLPGRIDTD